MSAKILLVDDEQDFIYIMGTRIQEWGYELVEALNGKDALDALKSKGPDIIILDYMMPGMDGVATLKEIRRINKKIPVVMFTAYPNIELMKETEKLGISAFIPKLSSYSDVQSSLKTALNMIEKQINKKS